MSSYECKTNIPEFYGADCEIEGSLETPESGTAILQLRSPRPLRIWIDGTPALDEPLFWRRYERELRAAICIPLSKGVHKLRVAAGARSGWPKSIDEHCPSRNREFIRSELLRRRPDVLEMTGHVAPDVEGPAVSLRFSPSQCVEDGVTWQHLLARRIPGFKSYSPTTCFDSPLKEPLWGLSIRGATAPFEARDVSTDEERARDVRRYLVPVANPLEDIAPVRKDGEPDERLEPECAVAKLLEITLDDGTPLLKLSDWERSLGRERNVKASSSKLAMPVFEPRGRKAPRREHKELHWPTEEELLAKVPRPLLPKSHELWRKSYERAWRMLLELRRPVGRLTGLPNEYFGTAMGGFFDDIFVWDSSFATMAAAWGFRAFPWHANLDCLYARLFDGGYMHREINIHDGLPDGYEPDFSPNPPIMGVAEWKAAALNGDTLRLAKAFPLLASMHRWIKANRRLPDGAYWTTGLANGLDNSPSLGDGYPDLTAQMAHSAEILSLIAGALGMESEKAHWEEERRKIGEAMNKVLWSEKMKFYSTSLPGGGHNPNKVVTGFWPLWTGLVPQERVEELAKHLLDPKSFWRHHPVPSLAADSPHFVAAGNYWLGSTWAPTNAATAWGFERAGRHDLAAKLVARHLDVLTEVYETSGHLWENYCSEKSERGSWSGKEYSWTALGPIALLLEIAIGIKPDALSNTLRWTLPEKSGFGAERIPMGSATISLELLEGRSVRVSTDKDFTLEIEDGGRSGRREIRRGSWTLKPEDFI